MGLCPSALPNRTIWKADVPKRHGREAVNLKALRDLLGAERLPDSFSTRDALVIDDDYGGGCLESTY